MRKAVSYPHYSKEFGKSLVFCAICLFFLGISNAFSLNPITFHSSKDLNFGGIVNGKTTSSFTLTTAGILTRTIGDAEIYDTNAEASSIRVDGTAELVDLQVNSGGSLVGPGTSIPIHLYTINTPVSAGSPGNYTAVGASIDIGSNQVPGVYTGTYTITANYQSDHNTTYTSNQQTVFLEVFPSPDPVENIPMSFGKVAINPGKSGVVRLMPDGSIQNITGDAEFFGGQKAGQFSIVGGVPGAQVFVSMSAENYLTGPGNNMSVTNLTSNVTSLVLDGSGGGSITVGADVSYGTGQADGIYEGLYTVYVNY